MDLTSEMFRDMLFWIVVALATGVAVVAVVMRLRRKPDAPRSQVRSPALAMVLVASLIALAIYLKPSGADSPNATRLSAEEAISSESEADTLTRQLGSHLEQQPRDARGWVILARLHADADRFTEAAQAYEKALALPSKVAGDPAVWCEYADALGMTQAGSLAGKPRELIDRALALNPNHPKALEMAGSAEYGQADYTTALLFWRPLLGMLEPGSQAYTELAAAIARTESLAATALSAQRQ